MTMGRSLSENRGLSRTGCAMEPIPHVHEGGVAGEVVGFQPPLPEPFGGLRFLLLMNCPAGTEVHPAVHRTLRDRFGDRHPGTFRDEVRDRVFLSCDLRSFDPHHAELEAAEIGAMVCELSGLDLSCVSIWKVSDVREDDDLTGPYSQNVVDLRPARAEVSLALAPEPQKG